MKQAEKRQWKKRGKALGLALACLVALALIWGFAVEPMLLTVTEIDHADARLPQAMDGLRIVFISDVHVGPFYSEHDVERVAQRIAALQPDMLLFGGDLLQHDEDAKRVDRARVEQAFAALRPKYGKFAVLGNHDIRTYEMQAIAEEILSGGGFTLLDNDAEQIAPGFFVAGTATWPDEGEFSLKNRADPAKAAWATENDAFVLLLSHEPQQARDNSRFPFALQLSGHTHGGQVALPFTGPIFMQNGAEVYKSGFYTVNGMTMYVSRGIGTSIVRVRFLAPPEIVVLTLHRK